MIAAIKTDLRTAELSSADRRMLDFAVHLTQTPHGMSSAHVDGLRAEGFDDTAIHDIVQVTALFNYYNRLADGLGIDLEPEYLKRQEKAREDLAPEDPGREDLAR